MPRLSNKIAVVTGAARGIGRAIAEVFADEGATVLATDVLEPEPYSHAGIEFRQLDVTSEQAWATVGSEVQEKFGRLDVLVNNAGVSGYDTLDLLSLEEWRRIVAVNQTGVFLGMRMAVPLMRQAGGGALVNVSSICGAAAVPGVAAYHATKGAVLTMTKNAAVTYAGEGIRANAVLPGWIRTPLTESQDDALNQGFIQATPMRRGAEPEDVAWGVLYLASDEARFVTGVDLPIDGGYLAQ